MTMRQYFYVLSIFLIGFFCSEALHKKDHVKEQTTILDDEILITSCDVPMDQLHLAPYRTYVNGKRYQIKDAPRGTAPTYRIENPNQNVIIFASKITP